MTASCLTRGQHRVSYVDSIVSHTWTASCLVRGRHQVCKFHTCSVAFVCARPTPNTIDVWRSSWQSQTRSSVLRACRNDLRAWSQEICICTHTNTHILTHAQPMYPGSWPSNKHSKPMSSKSGRHQSRTRPHPCSSTNTCSSSSPHQPRLSQP